MASSISAPGAGWLSHRKDKDQLGAVTNIFGNDLRLFSIICLTVLNSSHSDNYISNANLNIRLVALVSIVYQRSNTLSSNAPVIK